MSEYRIIVLNGAPGVGKDTAARLLARYGWKHKKFAQPLKDAGVALTGLPFHDLEAGKNNPRMELQGMSWRDWQIWMSEDIIKPKFGDWHFGTLMVRNLERDAAGDYVISDAGFQSEVDALVSRFGSDAVRVLRITRGGRDFSKDSRDYVIHNRVACVANDSSFNDFGWRILLALHKCWKWGPEVVRELML